MNLLDHYKGASDKGCSGRGRGGIEGGIKGASMYGGYAAWAHVPRIGSFQILNRPKRSACCTSACRMRKAIVKRAKSAQEKAWITFIS